MSLKIVLASLCTTHSQHVFAPRLGTTSPHGVFAQHLRIIDSHRVCAPCIRTTSSLAFAPRLRITSSHDTFAPRYPILRFRNTSSQLVFARLCIRSPHVLTARHSSSQMVEDGRRCLNTRSMFTYRSKPLHIFARLCTSLHHVFARTPQLSDKASPRLVVAPNLHTRTSHVVFAPQLRTAPSQHVFTSLHHFIAPLIEPLTVDDIDLADHI